MRPQGEYFSSIEKRVRKEKKNVTERQAACEHDETLTLYTVLT